MTTKEARGVAPAKSAGQSARVRRAGGPAASRDYLPPDEARESLGRGARAGTDSASPVARAHRFARTDEYDRGFASSGGLGRKIGITRWLDEGAAPALAQQ